MEAMTIYLFLILLGLFGLAVIWMLTDRLSSLLPVSLFGGQNTYDAHKSITLA